MTNSDKTLTKNRRYGIRAQKALADKGPISWHSISSHVFNYEIIEFLGLDPGPNESGFVKFSLSKKKVTESGVYPNDDLRSLLVDLSPDGKILMIERVSHYGRPVGASVLDTAMWSGVFAEAWGGDCGFITNTAIRLHFCDTARCKESHVRQAVIDRFPPVGGGARPQVGTKGSPGPLYGVKSHAWSALAAALCGAESALGDVL